MDLTTETVPGDGYVTLRVSGEIDLHTAPSLRDAALAALRKHGATLRIDLREVPFMDSTGLEVLLATRRRAELEGGSLTLLGPTPAVRRVIEVTGLGKLFPIAPDESGAPV
jgi:anti-sigma B factor antagonist